MIEEFVLNFEGRDKNTPIEMVSELTGLTLDEIRSCSKVLAIYYDPDHGYSNKIYINGILQE